MPLGLIGGIAVLVVVGLAASHNRFEREIVKTFQEHQLTIARSIAASVEEIVSEVEQDVVFLAKLAHLVGAGSARQQEIEVFFESHSDVLNCVQVTDADGNIIHQAPQPSMRMNISDWPGFAAARATGKPQISAPTYCIADREVRVIWVVAPIGDHGEFRGVVSASIDLTELWDKCLSRAEALPGSLYWVADSSGEILYDTGGRHTRCSSEQAEHDRNAGRTEDREEDLPEGSLLVRMSYGEEGAFVSRNDHADGNGWLIAFTPIRSGVETYGLAIITPQSEIAGPIGAHARISYALIVGMLLFLCIAGHIGLRGARAQGQLLAEQEHAAERKRAEEELRDSEMRTRALLDGSPVCNKIIDLDSRLLFMSAAGVKQLKIPDIQPFYGCTYPPDIYPEAMRAPLIEHLERAKAGEISSVECPVLDMEGCELWYHTTFVPIRDGKDRIQYIIGASVDITERKRAQEALKEQADLNQIFLDSLPPVAMLLRPKTREIVACNKAGYDVGAAPGKKCFETWGQSDTPCPYCLAPKLWATGEAQHLQPEGVGCIWDAHWIPITKDLYLHYAYDITEAKRTEEAVRAAGEAAENANAEMAERAKELQAARRASLNLADDLDRARASAEAANLAKSEFLANMSHEIRTPMTAILGFAENILDNDLSKSEKLNAIHTICRNGEYLLAIINDILDLSKIEAGQMTIERVSSAPCLIVAEVASLVRVQTVAKGLPLDIEYIGAIPETIQSDATHLRQILINLVGNAIKFTETGTVRLVTRFVPGERKDPLCAGVDEKNLSPSVLQFDVIDTGRGMTGEQTATLFQPFTQADTSATRKFGGTGLGLAISKRLANLLGGDISLVESKVGVGTHFRVTVATGPLEGVKMLEDPMSATVVADLAGAVARVAPSDLQGLRILLAEDGPDNQRLISFMLKKAGAEVTVEENGKLALEAALAARDSGNPFDVILMDMQMPVMDGYEATALLRQKGHTGPIIALTAHAMATDREKCIKAGCDDYASKPINRTKLIEMIQHHLSPAESASPVAT